LLYCLRQSEQIALTFHDGDTNSGTININKAIVLLESRQLRYSEPYNARHSYIS